MARHYHSGCRAHAEYFGVMLTREGRDCCSAFEGEFKASDGGFDRTSAQRQARVVRQWLRSGGERKEHDSGTECV